MMTRGWPPWVLAALLVHASAAAQPPGTSAPPGEKSPPPTPAASASASPGDSAPPPKPPLRSQTPGELFDGKPIPPGYRIEKRPRKAMAITGAVVSTTTYAAAVGLAIDAFDRCDARVIEGYGVSSYTECDDADAALWFIPVAGPFLGALTTIPAPLYIQAPLFWSLGLAQGTGVALLIAGLAGNERALVRDPPKRALSVVPMAMRQGGGVAVSGSW